MATIIQIDQLEKQYNPPHGVRAVKGVSFDIRRGEIFSLLGPNGAGKTTTISMLSCLLAPTGGDARVGGHSIKTEPMLVKGVIGVVPQEIALYPTISAAENLRFWGQMYGLRGKELSARVDAALDIAGLTDRARARVESFSGGMKRRLNIAVGLLHQPEILFLDEPTVGIDPQSRRRILDTILALNEQGMTVLYTTHYMEEAEELSHRIGIIDHGELIAVGSQEELTRLVGEHDVVRLAVDFNGCDSAALTQRLQTLPGVLQAAADDDNLLLQVQEADATLAAIIMAVGQAGAHVRRLEIQEPNLEAVFLHLTGRALRD